MTTFRHPSRLPAVFLGALTLVACTVAARRDPPPRRPLIIAPERVAGARTVDFDVEHTFLDLELDPDARAIGGTAEVRVRALRPELARVELDLVGLQVRAVRDGSGADLPFTHQGGVLAVSLEPPLAEGERATVAVDYGGSPRKGVWFRGLRNGRPTQVFTQGECEDSRWWFPCVDEPAERATSELRVRMPGTWVSLAAGERVERVEHGDGSASEHWRMDVSHPAYLTTLVAGEFEVRRGRAGDVPLVFLADARLAEHVEGSLEETGPALEFLGEVTGRPYPYAKYGQACVDDFPYGGMENISASTLSDRCLRDERGRRDRPATSLVVHEAAHQWFGDLLTCRDWSHVWLNEGFATYFTHLYFERTRGVDEFRARMRDSRDSYLEGDLGAKRRPIVHDVYRDPMDLFAGGHTYSGGASRLHLLRFVLGDEVFFAGVRRYVAEHAESGVVTADLRRAFEAESGRDLRAFFDLWLHSGGYPELQVGWSWDAARGEVALRVEQVQDSTDGTPEVFAAPVAVEVRSGDQRELHRLELDERAETFVLPAAERPTWVRFDKHGWLPARIESEKDVEEWRALLAEDDDVNGRREAVAALEALAAADHAQRDALGAALAGAVLGDPSRYVRTEACQALGRLLPRLRGSSAAAGDALQAAAGGDPDVRVRVAALDALRALGTSPRLAEFARMRLEEGVSWETMAAAASLTAAAEPGSSAELLAEVLAIESPHDELRCALLPRLVELHGSRAVPLLLEVVDDRQIHPASREVAARLLRDAGGTGGEASGVLLAQLADDSTLRLRREAVISLGVIGDPSVLPELAVFYRASIFPRERRVVEDVFREPWAWGVR